MTTLIIITICVLLLLAYIFDITASKTKIPSVILLLLLGWGVKRVSEMLWFDIPNLTVVLPILGTIGLILIVLEGALELNITKAKLPIILKSFFISVIPMLLLSFLLALAFKYFGNVSLRVAFANAIPFAIISSAIAIPSVQHLKPEQKEFITYESSLSDIIGVVMFNFITLNDNSGTQPLPLFFIQMVVILVITVVATLALSFLLSKIKHHVKFIPIMISIILIYSISKVFHLPALIFILLFGLFLGNINKLSRFKFVKKLRLDVLNTELIKFNDLTIEIAFLVRALFFLLFGFLIETSELLNSATIIWAIIITISIFGFRALFLRIFKIAVYPLVFVAPRGLITILLFLSIPLSQQMNLVSKSLVIQVIILTSLVMMFGFMLYEEIEEEEIEEFENEEEQMNLLEELPQVEKIENKLDE